MAGLEAVSAAANVATIVDFICPMIGSTVDRLRRHMTFTDLTEDLRILEETMWSIPDLMLVAKTRYSHISSVRNFVRRLQGLAYAAEDLVDELSYNELHQQVLDQASTSIADGKKRKRTSIMEVTPERIQSLKKNLDRVIRGLKKAFKVAEKLPPSVSLTHCNTTTTVIPSHRVTTSTIDLQKVCGREAEKEQMKEFLTPDPLIHDKKVFFFAVIGMGGLGKTTLAQYVFNNLKDRFDLKAWICISDAFDRKRLLQEIIAGIDPRDPQHKVTSIETLERTIQSKVEGKTLLLVLDDVWSTEWTKLLLPLQLSEAKCCKVIVTTREVKNITQTHDYESKMVSLVGLQDEEFRKLFEEQAFGDEDPSKHRALGEIGEKIARKLKGNPLAAKTVGAVLRENLEIQHWNRVVEDDLWNLGDKPDDIMPALMLSYLHLPPHLRRCFSYCALFPQDYQFNPERLVWMWIAEGYVVCTNPNERSEDVGFKYLRDLESRSFFVKRRTGYTDLNTMRSFDFYEMHDLVHDLATFVSLDECFMYREENSMSHEKVYSCHHLSVDGSNLHRLPDDLHHIRTLIVFRSDQYSEMSVPFKFLKSLKSVRVLMILGKDWDEGKISANQVISNDLGRLIHLRYLALIGMICEPLLNSICSLYHLHTLLLNPNYKKEYPNGMNSLINLRHLDGHLGFTSTISSIGKLFQLQELFLFWVEKGNLHNIGQLKEMNQLHGLLTIKNICQVEEVDDAKNANMEMKKYLTELRLNCCDEFRQIRCEDSNVELYENVLEYLKPHHSLETLKILDDIGSKPPSWLAAQSLQYIKRIKLECKNWCRISHLGQLPHLEYLEMWYMDLVVDLIDHVVVFPSLMDLDLTETSVEFEGISEEGQTSCQVFPKIHNIYCEECRGLEWLTSPLLLHGITSTLEDLSINGPISEELKAELDRMRLANNITSDRIC